MDGKLITQHCIESKSKTFNGDQWVTVEVEVHGNGKIKHFVNGEPVIQYEKPQLDDSDADAQKLIKADTASDALEAATSRSRRRAIPSSSARSRSCRLKSKPGFRALLACDQEPVGCVKRSADAPFALDLARVEPRPAPDR